MVLIDDESALNVCPLKTASCLGLSIEDFVPIDQNVRAYDNSRGEVLGTVTLEGGFLSLEHSIVLQYAPWVTMDP